MNSLRKKFRISGIVLAFALFLSQVQAAPIQGTITLGAVGVAANAGGDLTSFTGATMINFNMASSPNAGITSSTGDFVANGFSFGTLATFSDLTFAPAPGGVPLSPLWTSTIAGAPTKTASFDLLSISINNQTAASLDLTGTGVLKLTGFDDTIMTWVISGDTVAVGQPHSFVFGLVSPVVTIPEPSILVLFGFGLLGFIGAHAVRA